MIKTTMEAIEALPLFAAARRTDPPTSKAAAERRTAFAGDHARRILEALAIGPAGQTEIGRRCGLLPHQVNKRLSELRRAGTVELTGRMAEGGTEREWKATATKEATHGR